MSVYLRKVSVLLHRFENALVVVCSTRFCSCLDTQLSLQELRYRDEHGNYFFVPDPTLLAYFLQKLSNNYDRLHKSHDGKTPYEIMRFF